MVHLDPLTQQIILNFAIGLIITISLNIEVGFLRLPQFGRLLAVIIGAIVAAALPGRILALILGLPAGAEYAESMLNPYIVTTINTWLAQNPHVSLAILIFTIAMAALLGGLVGYLCAYPALRLKGPFLGITLLAFGDIMVHVSWNYPYLVGGTIGVWVIDPLRFLGPVRSSAMVLTILAIAVLVYVYAEFLARSPYGRMLKAIRDSELAAKVYGKDVIKARSQVLIIGGAMAGVGGALWALYTGSMKAVTYTRLMWTFWPWAFLMLGGVGNNLGVLVGVLIYTVVRTLIILYKGALAVVIPMSPEWLEYILIGMALILIMLFRPQGLIPEKPTPALPRSKLEEIRRRVIQESSSSS